MTLDKAIEIYEKGAKLTWNGKPTVEAEECQQMVEWLKELKSHREAWEKVRKGLRDKHRESYFIGVDDAIKIVDKYRPKEGDSNASAD